MNTRFCPLAVVLCGIVSTAYAAPTMSVIPLGLQSGNWAWEIDITPDLSLVPDNSGTPVAVELGFRLTSDPLVSVTNINTSQFDTSNPGAKIFGWEITYPDDNNRPEGIEANCIGCTISNPVGGGGHPTAIVAGTTNEIFVAMGSGNFTTPGAKPFLTILAQGPGNGGPSSSTLQWLGVYGTGSSNGRITQVTGLSGTTYTTSNFDTFSGTLTQSIPEPASALLLTIGAIVLPLRRRRQARIA
jgi:hypothetical protein